MEKKIIENKRFWFVGTIILLLIEAFICNFRYWESLFFKPVFNYQLAVGNGVVNVRDNVYYIDPEGDMGIYIYGLNDKVNNLYLDMDFVDDPLADNLIAVSSIDEGNGGFALTFKREYNPKIIQNHYFRTHFYGKASAIYVDMSDFSGTEVALNNIELNVKVPFNIAWIRLGIMIILLGIVYLFINARYVIEFTYEKIKHPRLWVIVMIALIWGTVFIWAGIAENNARFIMKENDPDQYIDLANALLQGKVSLDREVSNELMEMDNPYDYFGRINAHVSYLWDYSYYNGRYYVYFGIVPVLLFYIPFFVIAGMHLLTRQLVFVILGIALCGIFTLLWKVTRKNFPQTPVILIGLTTILIDFALGSCICHNPEIYCIPILTSLAFSVWGLYYGILGLECVGKKRILLFMSAALCLALTAGCRPQFLLVALFLLPSFIGELKKKEIAMKDKGGMVLAVAIPYIIVAAGLMYYNYIRFDSVFDFGANYNLTTNDMRHRGFEVDRIWDGIFFQLLQPIALTNVFPFVEQTVSKFSYNGIVIQEFLYGGLFAFCPFIYLGLYSVVKKNFYNNKKVNYYLWGSIALGMIILIMDTEMAGIVYRYILDFGVFFIAPAIVAAMEIFNNPRTEERNVRVAWFRGILLAITMSLVLYALFPFTEYDFLYNDFFMKVKTAVQFW